MVPWVQQEPPILQTLSSKPTMPALSRVTPCVLGQDMTEAEELCCRNSRARSRGIWIWSIREIRVLCTSLAKLRVWGYVSLDWLYHGVWSKSCCFSLAQTVLSSALVKGWCRLKPCKCPRWLSQPQDIDPGSGIFQCLVNCCFQVFRKILPEKKRRSFMQRALLGVHHVMLHASQAGLVFLYTILGEAHHLIRDKVSSRLYSGK